MSTHIPPLTSYMHGTEYEAVNGIFPGMQDHNVPCAVCYTDTKTVKVMIPARISCLPHGLLSIRISYGRKVTSKKECCLWVC